MGNQHLDLEDLPAAVFRTWPTEAERNVAETHLAACDLCRKLVEDERKVNPFLAVGERAEAQRKLDEYIQSLKRRLEKKQRFDLAEWINKTYEKLARLVRRR